MSFLYNMYISSVCTLLGSALFKYMATKGKQFLSILEHIEENKLIMCNKNPMKPLWTVSPYLVRFVQLSKTEMISFDGETLIPLCRSPCHLPQSQLEESINKAIQLFPQ